MHYIGIDMSKDSFHAAFSEQEVKMFANSDTGIELFICALKGRKCIQPDTEIGVEATGVYHLLLSENLRKHNWIIKIINPLITHKMFQSNLRMVKTDKHDAIAIRKALMAGAGYAYTDTPEILALKTLVQEREALCRMRATLKQRIKAHRIKEQSAKLIMHDGYGKVVESISAEMAVMEKEMSAYLPETQLLLKSITGIGKTSAAALVANIGDIKRFSNPEKLVAYLGLDCRTHQSGTSIHGKGFITKRGNTYLRYLLFNCAFIAKKHNPELRKYYEKKISEGKHHFSALCAIERKLIHIIYAVWTRGTPFEKH